LIPLKEQPTSWEGAMHAEVYTDGVDEITVGGAIVRVDLVSLSPTERDANDAPKKVFRQRLIFSIEGFANSVDVMQNALQGLVDAGVVKRNAPRRSAEVPGLSAEGEQSRQTASSNLRSPNVSTNFR
jgi:hypothetical protein